MRRARRWIRARWARHPQRTVDPSDCILIPLMTIGPDGRVQANRRGAITGDQYFALDEDERRDYVTPWSAVPSPWTRGLFCVRCWRAERDAGATRVIAWQVARGHR